MKFILSHNNESQIFITLGHPCRKMQVKMLEKKKKLLCDMFLWQLWCFLSIVVHHDESWVCPSNVEDLLLCSFRGFGGGKDWITLWSMDKEGS